MLRSIQSSVEDDGELSLAARKDVATRNLLQALQQFVELAIAENRAATDWISQDDSPLGRRAHVRAVNRGALPARKVGRKFFVRRSDMKRFLAGHRFNPAANDTKDGALVAALDALELSKAG